MLWKKGITEPYHKMQIVLFSGLYDFNSLIKCMTGYHCFHPK